MVTQDSVGGGQRGPRLFSLLIVQIISVNERDTFHNLGEHGECGWRVPSIFPSYSFQRVFSWQTKPRWATVPWPNYTLWLQSYGESANAAGNYVGQRGALIKSIKGRAGPHLQSQGFPAHVLEQCGGGAQRALRTLLQGQGHDAFIGPQWANQVT